MSFFRNFNENIEIFIMFRRNEWKKITNPYWNVCKNSLPCCACMYCSIFRRFLIAARWAAVLPRASVTIRRALSPWYRRANWSKSPASAACLRRISQIKRKLSKQHQCYIDHNSIWFESHFEYSEHSLDTFEIICQFNSSPLKSKQISPKRI